ncbi:hypothetical protein GCM10009663_46780 [Kitasatospora arboriphila]|uniref:Uncharacterized protein n=1 Tax=Kitasatospora arboriphila TaxID=258052 RepID=A0ABN1TQU8_9ACTN
MSYACGSHANPPSTGTPPPPGKTTGKELARSLPLSTYSARGALRQGPGGAAEFSTGAGSGGNRRVAEIGSGKFRKSGPYAAGTARKGRLWGYRREGVLND